MDSRFPHTAREIPEWASYFRLPIAAARQRYAQYIVLSRLATHNVSDRMAFKGGNALRMLYHNPRGTIDLDFSAHSSLPDKSDAIREAIEQAVNSFSIKHDTKTKLQSIHRNPAADHFTFPTYKIKVGYCFQGDRAYDKEYLENGRNLSEAVVLEVSINEAVCETRKQSIVGMLMINACTIDDIVAEKLRSLLQQPIRKRYRKQDVYDIAKITNENPDSVSVDVITNYLIEKCKARDINPKKSSYDSTIKEMASVDYEQLRSDTGEAFIEFDEAWDAVIRLVRKLGIDD